MVLRFACNGAWRIFRSSSSPVWRGTVRNLIVPATGVLSLAYHQNARYRLLNETLKPDPSGDTFEMGLYISSQREIQEKILQTRAKRLKRCRNVMTLCARKLLYFLKDNVMERIFTVLRFLEISVIFVPVFLAYPISFLGKHRLIQEDETTAETSGSLLWYTILRKALEWAGPSFIKLGQWAGSRTDMFPRGFCNELGKLHSNARAHSLAYTKEKICQSLNDQYEFDEIFEEFNDKPLGVGAIAQVYVGKLSESFLASQKITEFDRDNTKSRWCAVKIIHPNAGRQVNRDLKIMSFFANFINRIPTMEWLSLPCEVESFSIMMRLQLDLRIECLNLERFNENFKDSIQIKFPEGLRQLSTRDVLFEQYIHGFPMEKFLSIKDRLHNVELCQQVSNPFIDAFLQMLILDDFVHADLHPGNVMLRFVKLNKYGTKIVSSEAEAFQVVHSLKKKMREKDPTLIDEFRKVLEEYTPQICFIDVGLITELNKKNRTNFIALFNALARFDGYQAGELMIERSRTPETAINKEAFALKVQKLVNNVKKRTFTLGTISIGELLDQMLSMVRSHHVRMEGDFVSVVVAILLLEGIGRQLDPDLDLFASSLPILGEFGMQRENLKLLNSADVLSMLKVWIGLEIRYLISSSAKNIVELIKTDQLCPNY
ncbi:hypothetical protein HG536_0A06980 [Torulaspora globosa]|uniref:ABC1 atypical kinase-like domain-containing protein n=1 Tax=Torulaspora globosa TaxID=48254 RepID=A0A7G3ZBJ7_9SACH|nr:uncharacterized protein HG536_0A06980 [Torulaspora globosa]QLL30883.1 hypothetical protein HG536_0A06980 [Torulaspora globosa]